MGTYFLLGNFGSSGRDLNSNEACSSHKTDQRLRMATYDCSLRPRIKRHRRRVIFLSCCFALVALVALWQKRETVKIAKRPRSSPQKQRRDRLRTMGVDIMDILDAYEVPFIPWSGTLLGIHREGDIILGDNDVDLAIHLDEAEILLSENFRHAVYLKGYMLVKSSLNVWKVYAIDDYFSHLTNTSSIRFADIPEYLYCTHATSTSCKKGHIDLFVYGNVTKPLSSDARYEPSVPCVQRNCWYKSWEMAYETWFKGSNADKLGHGHNMRKGCPSRLTSELSRVPFDWITNTSSRFVPKLNRSLALPANAVDILTAVFGESWREPSQKRGHHFVTPCSICRPGTFVRPILKSGGMFSYECVACPEDQYSKGYHSTKCKPCPFGESTNGDSGQRKCWNQ